MYSWDKHFLRIGHSGAAAYAKPNTLKSLALALEMGVDVVEFDVLPCRDALVLSHDNFLHADGKKIKIDECSYADLRALEGDAEDFTPTLSDAIDLICGRALMNVDLKDRGYEAAVVETLRAKKILGNTMFSTTHATSLVAIRKLVPDAQTSISYPRDRGNAARRPRLKRVVLAALRAMRRTLPYRINRIMKRAHANMTTLNYFVISHATIERVHRAGGKVIAWTVDDLPTLRKLKALGVDGITTNKPDLFEQI